MTELQQAMERAESAEKWMEKTKESHDNGDIQMEFQAEYDFHMKTYAPKDELRDKWVKFCDKWQPMGHLNMRDAETIALAESLGIFNHRAVEALDKIVAQFDGDSNDTVVIGDLIPFIEGLQSKYKGDSNER